ncbi:MAG TPA: ribonuclease HI family protein [Terriglobales bacterium]|nr:ribonuclease HI family protein [Terriglobales bacterium]
MPIRPFPAKSRYRSQEFIGAPITSLDQGYLVASVDGGARGNPGPAGYGVVFEDEIGRPVAELSEFLGRQTNNYAEYSGLLAALNYTLRHGFKALRVISDSELMVKQISGEYKVSNPTLQELHNRATKLIDQLEYFEIKYVPREQNRQADRLANMAMDRGIAHRAPAVSATDVGGVASVMPELNGVVRDGVVHFTGDPLPEGTLVKVRAVKP